MGLYKEFILTPRRKQICDLLLQGLQQKEIAATMGITTSTVKKQIQIICQQKGMETNEIKLAVHLYYERNIHDYPFNGGDRAASLGYRSAKDTANRKLLFQ